MPQSDIERKRYDIERERYESRQKALRDDFARIDWAERKGLQKGLYKGLINSIEFGLEVKFGERGGDLMTRVRQVNDLDKLELIQQKLRTSRTLEEVSAFVQLLS